MKTERSGGRTLTYPNTGSAISSGDVIDLVGLYGIAETDIAATTGVGAVSITGEHELAATTAEAWAQGDHLYWNAGTKKLSAVVGAGKHIGVAARKKVVTTETTGNVLLNAPGETGGTAANVAALAGTLTGTVDGTIADVAATAGSCAGSASPSATNVDTAIATAVATIVTGVNTQLKEIQTTLNAEIAALKAAGVQAAS